MMCDDPKTVKIAVIGGGAQAVQAALALAKHLSRLEGVQVQTTRLQESVHFKECIKRLELSAKNTTKRFQAMSVAFHEMPVYSSEDPKNPNPFRPKSRGKGKQKKQWSK